MSETPLERLRQSLFNPALPDTVDVPAVGAQPARTMPIGEATLDEIAFALVAVEAENAARYRLASGLRQIIDLARQQGALGVDLAIPAAAARTEPRS